MSYRLPLKAILPGDVCVNEGEVVDVDDFPNGTIRLTFETGIIFEGLDIVVIEVEDVQVSLTDTELAAIL